MAAPTLTIPATVPDRLHLRPVVASLAIGGVIAVGFLGGTQATASYRLSISTPWLIALGVVAVFALLGGVQGLWWRSRLLPFTYEADAVGLKVLRHAEVLHTWAWRDVHLLRLEGRYGWYSLFTKQGVTEFPHLVVHAHGKITKAPAVPLWGHSEADRCEHALHELQRAAHGHH